ncbi:photosynthetic NDH subunit of lumenal location 5, chloroplastic [Ooceraea biroi]|uniref:photosynthetic NDH subunit of lumenal location 5, chloroplastic n=1 Tax=Ooceraea biroi TaxID=2015173 RepID=UPI000F07F518|nr:photosynthetic NDH subunit of lumenal location 5, chloroplastic [Ooceraea biroi]
MLHSVMNNKKSKKSRKGRIVPKVDNKPPYFPVSAYLKAFKLQQDAVRVRNIDKENIKLLKKLNIVYRLGGHVDCWAPDFKYKTSFDDQDRRNNVIMRENKVMLKKIRQAESQYPARVFLKQWRSTHEAVEHRARLPINISNTKQRILYTSIKSLIIFTSHRFVSIIERLSTALDVRKQLAEKSQTKCFFDVGIKGENLNFGRIVFELYDSIVPRTCENFAAFCRGTNGLSYKNTPFHRIVSGYWCQGGDVTKFDGTGGTSIYGNSFEKENFQLRHTGPGVLSMCNNENDRNDSKFNLTFRRLETMDENNVVFGQVIGGMTNIYKIEEFGTKTGKPIKSVIVLNCGILSKREHEKLSKLQI